MKHEMIDNIKKYKGTSGLYTYTGTNTTSSIINNSPINSKPVVSISEETEIMLPDNTKVTGKELSLIVKYLLPKIKEEYPEEFL